MQFLSVPWWRGGLVDSGSATAAAQRRGGGGHGGGGRPAAGRAAAPRRGGGATHRARPRGRPWEEIERPLRKGRRRHEPCMPAIAACSVEPRSLTAVGGSNGHVSRLPRRLQVAMADTAASAASDFGDFGGGGFPTGDFSVAMDYPQYWEGTTSYWQTPTETYLSDSVEYVPAERHTPVPRLPSRLFTNSPCPV